MPRAMAWPSRSCIAEAHRRLLLRDHHEHALGQNGRQPARPREGEAGAHDAQVPQPRRALQFALDLPREVGGVRVEVVHTRAVVPERVHAVRERIVVDGHEEGANGGLGGERPRVQRDGGVVVAGHDDARAGPLERIAEGQRDVQVGYRLGERRGAGCAAFAAAVPGIHDDEEAFQRGGGIDGRRPADPDGEAGVGPARVPAPGLRTQVEGEAVDAVLLLAPLRAVQEGIEGAEADARPVPLDGAVQQDVHPPLTLLDVQGHAARDGEEHVEVRGVVRDADVADDRGGRRRSGRLQQHLATGDPRIEGRAQAHPQLAAALPGERQLRAVRPEEVGCRARRRPRDDNHVRLARRSGVVRDPHRRSRGIHDREVQWKRRARGVVAEDELDARGWAVAAPAARGGSVRGHTRFGVVQRADDGRLELCVRGPERTRREVAAVLRPARRGLGRPRDRVHAGLAPRAGALLQQRHARAVRQHEPRASARAAAEGDVDALTRQRRPGAPW